MGLYMCFEFWIGTATCQGHRRTQEEKKEDKGWRKNGTNKELFFIHLTYQEWHEGEEFCKQMAYSR